MNPTTTEALGPPDPPVPAIAPEDRPTPFWKRMRPVDIASLAVVSAAFGAAYWPNLLKLYDTWSREPDYSHGFLVLPIALVILWKRWPAEDEATPRAWWPGWLLVVAALVGRAYLHERGSTWSETATLLVVIVGLALARLGPGVFARTWPAFAFLLFLLPLPTGFNNALSQPLQALATSAVCKLLRLTGLWVMPEGNVILVGGERLEVAAACNGLSMLMSLAATVAATASLITMATAKRVVLLLSIIPIALLSNILRIAATAWCYHLFGAQVGGKYAHDLAGWAMMPMAMALVFLEMAVMSWLIVESVEAPRNVGLLPLGGAPRAGWDRGGRS